jgi:ribosomal protein S10
MGRSPVFGSNRSITLYWETPSGNGGAETPHHATFRLGPDHPMIRPSHATAPAGHHVSDLHRLEHSGSFPPAAGARVRYQDTDQHWHWAYLRVDHDRNLYGRRTSADSAPGVRSWHLESGSALGSPIIHSGTTVAPDQNHAEPPPPPPPPDPDPPFPHLIERPPFRPGSSASSDGAGDRGDPAKDAPSDGAGSFSAKPPDGMTAGAVTYTIRDLDPGAPYRPGDPLTPAELHQSHGSTYYIDRENKPRACEIVGRQETRADGTTDVKLYEHGRPSGSWEHWDGGQLREYHHEFTDPSSGTHIVEDLKDGSLHRTMDVPAQGTGPSATPAQHVDLERRPDGDWHRVTVVHQPDGSADTTTEQYDAKAHERIVEHTHLDAQGHKTVDPVQILDGDGGDSPHALQSEPPHRTDDVQEREPDRYLARPGTDDPGQHGYRTADAAEPLHAGGSPEPDTHAGAGHAGGPDEPAGFTGHHPADHPPPEQVEQLQPMDG